MKRETGENQTMFYKTSDVTILADLFENFTQVGSQEDGTITFSVVSILCCRELEKISRQYNLKIINFLSFFPSKNGTNKGNRGGVMGDRCEKKRLGKYRSRGPR